MMQCRFWPIVLLPLAASLVSAQTSPTTQPAPTSKGAAITFPKIDRRPTPAVLKRGRLNALPPYAPQPNRPAQVDLRGCDLSALDMAAAANQLLHADFDTGTQWPAKDRLPSDFDPQRVMELGQNPGLGVRSLHARGITGKGVGLAIIDQPLLTSHREYADHLQLYEEIGLPPDAPAQMHGPAVASIAVGQRVGVAPGADLYFVGSWPGEAGVPRERFTYDFQYLAKSVHRIIEVNRQLPSDRKIRVLSISIGWQPNQKGAAEMSAAVQQAGDEGIFVISSSLERTHHLRFHGLGRNPTADPDRAESYEPGAFWAHTFNPAQPHDPEWLLVPMDARTVASFTGPEDYYFCRNGGWSWSIPYLAGLYALAVQVDPQITPERFWDTALRTGRTIHVRRDDGEFDMKTVADPVSLIGALQSPPTNQP